AAQGARQGSGEAGRRRAAEGPFLAQRARHRATLFRKEQPMKTVTLLAAAILAWPLASFAQTPQKDSSPHCNTLSGAEKDQCLRDEAAKTDSKAEPGSAPSGGSVPSESPQSAQDRSPHCHTLSRGEKSQCLNDEP